VEGSHLSVVDEWQDVAVTIDAPGAIHLWVAPIETVSESEEDSERVYQGSQSWRFGPWKWFPPANERETVLYVTAARRQA